jgi:hypothetical protein
VDRRRAIEDHGGVHRVRVGTVGSVVLILATILLAGCSGGHPRHRTSVSRLARTLHDKGIGCGHVSPPSVPIHSTVKGVRLSVGSCDGLPKNDLLMLVVCVGTSDREDAFDAEVRASERASSTTGVGGCVNRFVRGDGWYAIVGAVANSREVALQRRVADVLHGSPITLAC